MPALRWDEAVEVLEGWSGRDVVVVPFLEPGISLEPTVAPLVVERAGTGVVRIDLPTMPIALRRATFIEAGWVPGQDERGLSVVQGGVRVDVFLDGDDGYAAG